METLPAKPRWRDVIRTAEFVLNEASAAGRPDGPISLKRAEVAARLKVLRDILREGGGHRVPLRLVSDTSPPAA
jgi:two-component system sensor histidine kinase ChiS